MSHVYDYFPCANCGQRVAHTKDGVALHMHRDSAKCKRDGLERRARVEETRKRTRTIDQGFGKPIIVTSSGFDPEKGR